MKPGADQKLRRSIRIPGVTQHAVEGEKSGWEMDHAGPGSPSSTKLALKRPRREGTENEPKKRGSQGGDEKKEKRERGRPPSYEARVQLAYAYCLTLDCSLKAPRSGQKKELAWRASGPGGWKKKMKPTSMIRHRFSPRGRQEEEGGKGEGRKYARGFKALKRGAGLIKT